MTPSSIRRLVWGLTVFAGGIILLLQAFEILPGSAWKYIWPLFVIIIGFELILTALYGAGDEVEVEIPKHLFRHKARRRK